jgi:predicted pyridoxine 5'-phosphate oxidase superfamily flavin-nucleotide-binding protein
MSVDAIERDPPRDEPFHAGEQALQRRTGVRERLAEVGSHVMRHQMPEQHRELFGKLPWLLVGSLDADGRPHASALAGPPGFAHAPDAGTMVVSALPDGDDPLAAALHVGASLGVLGIEPHTRRRNRMNGIVAAVDSHGFAIDVQQSFGNCPKYIQARQARWDDAARAAPGAVSLRAQRLDARAIALVRASDTFYIASSTAPDRIGRTRAHGVDVSHRGGKPGFVRVDLARDGTQTLTVPDFTGNFFFNTLGNLAAHPRAGLLFIDLQRGDLLQVSCDADVLWEGDELASFVGAQRLLKLRVRAALRRDRALPLRWGDAALSPHLLPTGAWPG